MNELARRLGILRECEQAAAARRDLMRLQRRKVQERLTRAVASPGGLAVALAGGVVLALRRPRVERDADAIAKAVRTRLERDLGQAPDADSRKDAHVWDMARSILTSVAARFVFMRLLHHSDGAAAAAGTNNGDSAQADI